MFLVCAGPADAAPEAGCERQTVAMLPSPDAAWSALFYEDICSHGPAFTTVVLDRIRLVRRGEESNEDSDVLILQGPVPVENRMQPRWLSPQELQITIPNNSVVTEKRSRYGGIEVIVKFNPDDPVQRERFLEEHGLPPD